MFNLNKFRNEMEGRLRDSFDNGVLHLILTLILAIMFLVMFYVLPMFSSATTFIISATPYFGDTYVDQDNTAVNYATETTLILQNNTTGDMEMGFQVDIVNALSVLEGANVSNVEVIGAKLYLVVSSVIGAGLPSAAEVYQPTTEWNLSDVTFGTKPTLDRLLGMYPNSSAIGIGTTAGDWVVISQGLGGILEEYRADGGTAWKKGFWIKDDDSVSGGDAGLTYLSSDNAVKYPILEVEYRQQGVVELSAEQSAALSVIPNITTDVQGKINEATAYTEAGQNSLRSLVINLNNRQVQDDHIVFDPISFNTVNDSTTRVGFIGRSGHPYSGTFAIIVNRYSQTTPVAPPFVGLFHDQGTGITYASSTEFIYDTTIAKHFAYFWLAPHDATGPYVANIIQKNATGDISVGNPISFTHGIQPTLTVDETDLATKLDVINLSNGRLKARTAIANTTLTKLIDTQTYPSIVEPSAQPGQIVAVESVTNGTFQVTVYDYNESGGYAGAGVLFASAGKTLEQVASEFLWDASVIIGATPSDWP